MSLFDYINESNKIAENQRTQDNIIANGWKERAIKAVDDCFDEILRISKEKINKIIFNNKSHEFEVVIVVEGPRQDEPSKAGRPSSCGNAAWYQDTLTGVRRNRADMRIYVCNKKEQEYCASEMEKKLVKEGFRIQNKKRTKYRTSTSYIVITATMSW